MAQKYRQRVDMSQALPCLLCVGNINHTIACISRGINDACTAIYLPDAEVKRGQLSGTTKNRVAHII